MSSDKEEGFLTEHLEKAVTDIPKERAAKLRQVMAGDPQNKVKSSILDALNNVTDSESSHSSASKMSKGSKEHVPVTVTRPEADYHYLVDDISGIHLTNRWIYECTGKFDESERNQFKVAFVCVNKVSDVDHPNGALKLIQDLQLKMNRKMESLAINWRCRTINHFKCSLVSMTQSFGEYSTSQEQDHMWVLNFERVGLEDL